MKIIYFDDSLTREINKVFNNQEVEIDYRGPVSYETQPRATFLDKIKHKLDELLGRNAMGGEIPPGFIPPLIEGLSIVVDVSKDLFVGILGAKLYDLYGKADKNAKSNDYYSKANNPVLQIITDDTVFNFPEDTRVSVSFSFKSNLDEENFLKGIKQISEIRDKIQELFKTVAPANINRIECTYVKDRWRINFLNL